MPSSSIRSSWLSRRSSPAAIRAATCSVGLVSPRSTCESIGAETPERSARSRSERSIASRSTRTRGPTETTSGSTAVAIRLYVITYNRTGRRLTSPERGCSSGMRPLLVCLLLVLLSPGAALAANDPRRGEQWNLDLIESDAAHATSTGAGAVIAVVDTGVAAGHPDLAGQILPGHDFVQDDATPQDGNGHGSHVSGIALAATGNGVGISSVAPGAKLLPVRVLDDDGSGTSEDVAAGIDWARTHGADVINLSLGSEIPIVGASGGDEIDAAIRRALAAGLVVVAAAGNNGVPVCEQPAASE